MALTVTITLCDNGSIEVRGLDSDAVREWGMRHNKNITVGMTSPGQRGPWAFENTGSGFIPCWMEDLNPWRDKYNVVTGPTLGPDGVEPQPVIVESATGSSGS